MGVDHSYEEAGQWHSDTKVYNDEEELARIGKIPSKITQIRIWASEYIVGMEVFYDNVSAGARMGSEYYKGVYSQDLTLGYDEYIKKVYGRSGKLIDQLSFKTTKGREITFGTSKGGHKFKMKQDGKVVNGFKIGFGGHLHCIGTFWGHKGGFKPTPAPAPMPVPIPTPSPMPIPTPSPMPIPTPSPMPIPTPSPMPIPTPSPGFPHVTPTPAPGFPTVTPSFPTPAPAPTYPTVTPTYPTVTPTYPTVTPTYPTVTPTPAPIPTPSFPTVTPTVTPSYPSAPGTYTPTPSFPMPAPAPIITPVVLTQSNVAGKVHADTIAFNDYTSLLSSKYDVRLSELRVIHDNSYIFGIEALYEADGMTISGGMHVGSEMNHSVINQSVVLGFGETITSITGQHGNVIDSIAISTSSGKIYKFGGTGGKSAYALYIPAGRIVKAFAGGCGGHLHNIS